MKLPVVAGMGTELEYATLNWDGDVGEQDGGYHTHPCPAPPHPVVMPSPA